MTHFVFITVGNMPGFSIFGVDEFKKLLVVKDGNVHPAQKEIQAWLNAISQKIEVDLGNWLDWKCCDGSYNRDIWNHPNCPSVSIETETFEGKPTNQFHV
jgi:hypothetical protein